MRKLGRKILLKLIANWQNETSRCHFCGKTKSVKYITDIEENGEIKSVKCCNLCALLRVGKDDDK